MKPKFPRRIALSILFLGVIIFGIAPSAIDKSRNKVVEHSPYPLNADAIKLHASLIIADMHADPTLWNRNLLKHHTFGHMDLPRMREGNMAIQVFTTVTKSPRGMNYEHNHGDSLDNITLLALSQLWPMKTWNNLTERALHQAQKLHQIQAEAPNQFLLIRSKEDLDYILARRSSGEKIIGGLLGTEGSHALEGNLDNITRLYKAGFRMMSLQHFFDNQLGGSLHGSSKSGLSEFGKQVVKTIDAMPMVLDLSHSSEAVVRETLTLIEHPPVISHTGIYSHCQSPRNIPDDLMLKIARRGGLIGIGFWDAVCDISPSGIAAAIHSAINLVGEDHVALGSDFDGAVTTAIDASELAAITQALLDEGLSEQTIRKVMGENLIRLFYSRLPRKNQAL